MHGVDLPTIRVLVQITDHIPHAKGGIGGVEVLKDSTEKFVVLGEIQRPAFMVKAGLMGHIVETEPLRVPRIKSKEIL